MPRSQYKKDVVDGAYSDTSLSPLDDMFDADKADHSDTDPSELDDKPDIDGLNDFLGDIDLKDQHNLFQGNAYPPEFYRQAIENFTADQFDGNAENYEDSTKAYLDTVEGQWQW
jgi:hypothetical protein